MPDDLKSKAKVILDLLDHGAEEVEITGTDIKVVRKKGTKKSASGPTQIVNVHTQATAHSSSAIELRLNLAFLELKENYKESKRLDEIDEKQKILEKELAKTKPNKNTLKKILQWALDFGWDIFVRIAPIIIDKVILSA